jgi:hypothetical protein
MDIATCSRDEGLACPTNKKRWKATELGMTKRMSECNIVEPFS